MTESELFLRDTALRDEIELVSDLVVAATSSSEQLSEAEIDAALGIDCPGSAQT